MRSRTALFVTGLAGGAVAGWVLGQSQMQRHRDALFSPHPIRRLSALGYLAGEADVETVRLLRDYLDWEPQPVLRRRAQAILQRLEATLG